MTTDNDQAAVERDRLMLEVAQATATWKHAQAERENHWYARLHREESAWGAEKARADKAEAANKLLIDELIPVGWEVLTSAGCPRCGCDVVAEPAMDGDGFVDGNPARCQSCGLPGQVTCDDDGAYFSADDNQWEIEEVAKRADKATAERDRLAGLLRDANDELGRWDDGKTKCYICGEEVLWRNIGLGWHPIQYHDCKPVPGARLEQAERERDEAILANGNAEVRCTEALGMAEKLGERLEQAVALVGDAQWLISPFAPMRDRIREFLAGQPAPVKVAVDDAMVSVAQDAFRIRMESTHGNLTVSLRAALVAALAEVGKS